MKFKGFSVKNDAFYDFRRSLRTALIPSIAVLLTLLYTSVYCSLYLLHRSSEDYRYVLFLNDNLSFSVYLFLLLIGAVAGIAMFRFLASKQQVNVMLSIGLTRTQLFRNRCIAFILELLIAVIVPLTITLAVNIGTLGVNAYMLKAYAFYLVSILTVVLIGFSIAVLSSVIAGTLIESFVLTAAFTAVPMGMLLFLNACLGFFLKGYYPRFLTGYNLFPAIDFLNPTYDSMITNLNYLNPIMLPVTSFQYGDFCDWGNYAAMYSDAFLERNRQFYQAITIPNSDFVMYIGWIIVSLFILLFASRVFKKRRSEIAGIYKSSKFTAAAIGTVIMIYLSGFGLASGIFTVREPLNSNCATYLIMGISEKLQIFGQMLLYPLLGLIVFLLLYTFNVKRFLKCMKFSPLILLTLVVPVICISGGFGYEKRIPDADAIEKIFVSYPFAPGYSLAINYPNAIIDSDDYSLSQSWRGFESPRDKEMVLSLHSSVINDTDNSASGGIDIYYKLKDGSTLKRTYTEYSDKSLLTATMLFDSDTVKTKLYRRLCDKDSWLPLEESRNTIVYNNDLFEQNDYIFENSALYFENVNKVILKDANRFSETDISSRLSSEKFDTLIKSIGEDYRDMSAQEYYNPTSPCKFILKVDSITINTYDQSESTNSLGLVIYSSMARTLSYLQTLGISVDSADNNDIVKIALYECNRNMFYKQIYDPLYSTPEINGPEALIAKTEKVKAVTPYAVYTNKNDIDSYAHKLNICYLTVDKDVSYAAVTYSDGKQAVFIVKK